MYIQTSSLAKQSSQKHKDSVSLALRYFLHLFKRHQSFNQGQSISKCLDVSSDPVCIKHDKFRT